MPHTSEAEHFLSQMGGRADCRRFGWLNSWRLNCSKQLAKFEAEIETGHSWTQLEYLKCCRCAGTMGKSYIVFSPGECKNEHRQVGMQGVVGRKFTST